MIDHVIAVEAWRTGVNEVPEGTFDSLLGINEFLQQ